MASSGLTGGYSVGSCLCLVLIIEAVIHIISLYEKETDKKDVYIRQSEI